MTPRAVLRIESDLRLDPEAAVEGIDWAATFGRTGPVEVEIGIGKGRFLLAVAALRPEVDFLGVEWANRYLRIAETRAVKRGLANLRFVRADAKDLLARGIPDDSVDAYYVFYPDPWPKKRHHKRRLFELPTPDHFARTLVSGGLLHVATDHRDYWAMIERTLDRHPAFRRIAVFGGDRFPLPVDQPLTNFETKYRTEGRNRFRATWERLPRG